MLVLAALVMCIAAFVVVYIGVHALQPEPFTQFWLIPTNQSPSTFQVGIQNHELMPVNYTIQIRQGRRLLREWSTIRLNPGDLWQETFEVTGLPVGRIEAHLLRDGSMDIYRQVWLMHDDE